MLRDVAELLNVRPHMRTSARFDATELRAYHEGYYTGIVIALRVLDLAVGNYKATTARRRAETRRRESA